ncbi:MAG TPA: glycosyltransferase family 4 protein, partial [Treponemataceae bacterium]|nr:glycosyltransferase family 4 protein [Treponemataceae bacterium]
VNFARILQKKYEVDLYSFSEPILDGNDRFGRVEIADIGPIDTLSKAIKFFLLGKSLNERYNVASVRRQLARVLEEGNYDCVVCTYITTMIPLIGIAKCPIILDMVDVLSLSYKEAKGVSSLVKFKYWLEIPRSIRLERICADLSRKVLITSKVEKAYVDEMMGVSPESSNIVVVSNGVDVPKGSPSFASEKSPINIGFLGRMDYYANVIASRRLVNNIFPAIKSEFPGVECRIIGANPDPAVVELRSDSVVVTGFVDDLEAELRKVDIMVLPMTIASGVQNKLLFSMAAGKAAITTSRVDTGDIPFVNGESVFFAETDGEFADAIRRLMNDRNLLASSQRAARELIMHNASWESIGSKLLSLFADNA